jgi:hypothetical protein
VYTTWWTLSGINRRSTAYWLKKRDFNVGAIFIPQQFLVLPQWENQHRQSAPLYEYRNGRRTGL